MSTVVWSHDTGRDPKIPVELVKPWLEANGNTTGRTLRFEILADGDGTLRWWSLGPLPDNHSDSACCWKLDDESWDDWSKRFHSHHADGPFTSPLRVPLPDEMRPYVRAGA
jgi:hypothetical protein